MAGLKTLKDNELLLIRHAPIASGGRLYGRTDVAANVPSPEALSGLAARVSNAARKVTSPALRCRQTGQALWGEGAQIEQHPELWEQDFGEWEGMAFEALPDLGTLSGEALAAQTPPGGESFDDVCRRAEGKLLELASPQSGPTVAVVHAGIVRACLALAIGSKAAGLRFEIDCLSLTRLSRLSDGTLSIGSVNEQLLQRVE